MASLRGRVISSRYRRALSRTAIEAVWAGQSVVPGAWWSSAGRRFECDLAGCTRTGPHPAVRNELPTGQLDLGDGLARQAVSSPEAAGARWSRHPYTVLMATGETCDAVDVPAELGRTLATQLSTRTRLGPVIASASRWLFLTATGGRLPTFARDILIHSKGSWIMLPPSQGPGGESAVWLVPPTKSGWMLPPRDELVVALSRVVPLEPPVARVAARAAISVARPVRTAVV